MITCDENKLSAIYENMGDYPPGMSGRDMDHIHGSDEQDNPEDFDWELLDYEDDEENPTRRNVTIRTTDQPDTYIAKAKWDAPYKDLEFYDIVDIEVE